MKIVILAVALISLVAGCSNTGASGVTSDKQVNELSQEELTKLCEWGIIKMNEVESAKCPSDDVAGPLEDTTSTAKSDEVSTEKMQECMDSLTTEYKTCSVTVEQMEACLTAHSKSPCTSEDDLAECKILVKNCNDGEDDKKTPVQTQDGGTSSSAWISCYLDGASGNIAEGCSHSWRCPYGADRALNCLKVTAGYQCTCKNIKEGTEEGTFSSDDICTLADHNVAYRANQSCGWQLPEN